MRVAQVAPLIESVPPKLYGGTERIVSFLTEELVRQGHDVTLYASGDSQTAARLVPVVEQSIRLDGSIADSLAIHYSMLERVFREAGAFDVIHFHCDYLHFPWSRGTGMSRLTTLHGRLDLPELRYVHAAFPDEPLVSISFAQRRPLAWLSWAGTVYHGLPRDLLSMGSGAGGYLGFLGRISPEKRPDRAVEIARRIGMPLKIAAKVDKVDTEYYNAVIAPLLDGADVEFIGEIGDHEKQEFLGNAHALLFPIDWPEPFGLVMIEAMACGTPVVAYGQGSVPEIVDPGETGFIVDDLNGAVEAVHQAGLLSRARCRAVFEQRFTAERMATDYVALYERLMESAGRAASRAASWTTSPPLTTTLPHSAGHVAARSERAS
jgi:glycosyltransferase involved in cell wall biosynthesis